MSDEVLGGCALCLRVLRSSTDAERGADRVIDDITEGLEIVHSELGGRAGVVGAATMARRRTDAPTPLTEQD